MDDTHSGATTTLAWNERGQSVRKKLYRENSIDVDYNDEHYRHAKALKN